MTLEVKLSRWRCLCAYDGTVFNGWQKQPDRGSVQDKIEECLEAIFRQPVRTVGSGRTDAGVHARGQVFHFDARWKHSAHALLQSLRVSLPSEISPRKIDPVPAKFHAHLSAKGKRYVYRICKGWAMPDQNRYVISMKDRPLDLESMREAAVHFLGTHDFSSFSANRGKGDEESPVKRLWRVEWREKGNELNLIIEGGGFLYKMVRSIAGAMIDVGQGKIKPQEIPAILSSATRTARVVSAPAQGLSLEKVFYQLPAKARIHFP